MNLADLVHDAAEDHPAKPALVFQGRAITFSDLDEPAVERLSVCHGEAPDVDELLELLAPKYARDDIRIGIIGAVIGTHAGPRVMGVTWQVPETT